jgi:hypothetical protein
VPVEQFEVALAGVKPVGHVTGPTEHKFVLLTVALELSQQIIAAGVVLETVDLNEAILALFLALLKLTNTIDAKIPMIAITIKSSIRVKPLRFIGLILLLTFVLFFSVIILLNINLLKI